MRDQRHTKNSVVLVWRKRGDSDAVFKGSGAGRCLPVQCVMKCRLIDAQMRCSAAFRGFDRYPGSFIGAFCNRLPFCLSRDSKTESQFLVFHAPHLFSWHLAQQLTTADWPYPKVC